MDRPNKICPRVHFGPWCSLVTIDLWGWTGVSSVSLNLGAHPGPFFLGWQCLGLVAEQSRGSRKVGALGTQGMQCGSRRNLDKSGEGWSDGSGPSGAGTEHLPRGATSQVRRCALRVATWAMPTLKEVSPTLSGASSFDYKDQLCVSLSCVGWHWVDGKVAMNISFVKWPMVRMGLFYFTRAEEYLLVFPWEYLTENETPKRSLYFTSLWIHFRIYMLVVA